MGSKTCEMASMHAHMGGLALLSAGDVPAKLCAHVVRRPLPEGVLLMVLQKLPAVLQDEGARDRFQVSGGLGLIQQLNSNPNTLFARLVAAVNNLFPEQVRSCIANECTPHILRPHGLRTGHTSTWGRPALHSFRGSMICGGSKVLHSVSLSCNALVTGAPTSYCPARSGALWTRSLPVSTHVCAAQPRPWHCFRFFAAT